MPWQPRKRREEKIRKIQRWQQLAATHATSDELGGNHLKQINKDQLQRHFAKHLQKLRHKAVAEPSMAHL